MEISLTNESIAKEWRARAWVKHQWRACSNYAGTLEQLIEGEAGGLMVTCDAMPDLRCYMKPRRKSHTIRRAAREKIASDLGHDLDISVPPVVLSERSDAEGEEQYVAISLVMFPRQDSWEVVRRALERESKAAQYYRAPLPKAAARAWAFDTWLGQTDHTDESPDNIIFGYAPENLETSGGRYLFLDYSFAIGHLEHWAGNKMFHCVGAPFPEQMQDQIDRPELEAVIDKIENFPEDVIKDIVTRIPVSHLGDEEKAWMTKGLIARRKLVRQALEGALS